MAVYLLGCHTTRTGGRPDFAEKNRCCDYAKRLRLNRHTRTKIRRFSVPRLTARSYQDPKITMGYHDVSTMPPVNMNVKWPLFYSSPRTYIPGSQDPKITLSCANHGVSGFRCARPLRGKVSGGDRVFPATTVGTRTPAMHTKRFLPSRKACCWVRLLCVYIYIYNISLYTYIHKHTKY